MKGPHAAGEIIGGRYKVESFVGEGGMQFVYGAEDAILKRTVALKTPKNNTAQKRFKRSAEVSARVNHPNVAKTLDYFEDEGRQYLVEELIIGADLDKSLLKRAKYLDPYLAAKIFHHLARGLAASHHAGVIHRDLKPTNVMVTGDFQIDSVKVRDFGIAKMAQAEIEDAIEGDDPTTITTSQTAVGALPYMAPEAIETPKDVDTSADVWSIGAMMFELVTGEKPFGAGLAAVKKIIDASPPEFPDFMFANGQFKPLAEDICDLIKRCLNKNPKKRPSADDLVRLCGGLYYPPTERYLGIIKTIMHNAWGFITVDGEDLFFHRNSVYGEQVNIGDKVMLSKFIGGGAWRAHPVVKITD